MAQVFRNCYQQNCINYFTLYSIFNRNVNKDHDPHITRYRRTVWKDSYLKMNVMILYLTVKNIKILDFYIKLNMFLANKYSIT